jgi:hypothetical protein
MKLLDTFKKIFGLEGLPHVITHEQRILPKPVLTVEPVMVTPKAAPAKPLVLHNEKTLAKLSKNQIAEVAATELGVEISLRLKKEDMIDTYLAAQRKF